MPNAQTLTFTLRGPEDSILCPALRKACDRCRRRKTKCDGLDECTSCSKAGVVCSYLTVHKRKGPKPRGKRQGLPSSVQNACSRSKSSHPSGSTPPRIPKQIHHEINDKIEFQHLEYAGKQVSEARSNENESIFGYEPLISSMHSDESSTELWEDTSTETPLSWNDQFHPAFDDVIVQASQNIFHEREYQHNSKPENIEDVSTARANNQGLHNHMLPVSVFKPYLTLFFERLYPIFPVLDRDSLLGDTHAYQASEHPISVEQYALLTSLSAAVIVQLNILNQTCLIDALNTQRASSYSSSALPIETSFFSADFFISQCIHARQQWDFMESPDEHTILTSFFLFEYYGNRNQAHKAWYYLREAIGFALSLGLDEPDSYNSITGEIAQRRCRLFWLLFVTERAYALQHKSGVMLRPSIDLPKIFESKDPKLIYGFVNLVSLFKSVDNSFVSAWKSRRLSDAETSSTTQLPMKQSFLHQERHNSCSAEGALVLEIDEVQRLDFMVTQQWLYLLSWQLKSRPNSLPNGQLVKKISKAAEKPSGSILFPFRVSKDLLGIINKANRQSLECHGIGMEQKIFDVACCLSDVLGNSQNIGRDTFSAGHQILHGFMTMLASFRNQESRYLQPLLSKAATILASALPPPVIGNDVARCEEWDDEQQWDVEHVMQELV